MGSRTVKAGAAGGEGPALPRGWEVPAYLLKAPAVRHGGDHLRELFLLALQHAVHVLGRDLQAEGHRRGRRWERWAPRRKLSACLPPASPLPLCHIPWEGEKEGAQAGREGESHVLGANHGPGTRPS